MSFAKPPSKAARGRSVSSTAPAASARPPRSTAGTQARTRTPSVSSTSSSRSSQSRPLASAKDDASSVPARPSRPSSVSSGHNAASSEPGPSTAQHNTQPQPEQSGSSFAPQPTSDPLQVAAQVYPWMYMSSTLDACFKSAEAAAESDLAARETELAEEEADLSDQRVRLEAERRVEFYDELATDEFASAAPSIMQAFLAHGDTCTQVEADALKLATRSAPAEEDYYSPMRPYNALLDKLADLQRKEAQLHASIVALTQGDAPEDDGDEPSARAQLMHMFAACLPLLEARGVNLQMAHELLEGAKENLAMSLHLESLEFSDGEEEE